MILLRYTSTLSLNPIRVRGVRSPNFPALRDAVLDVRCTLVCVYFIGGGEEGSYRHAFQVSAGMYGCELLMFGPLKMTWGEELLINASAARSAQAGDG